MKSLKQILFEVLTSSAKIIKYHDKLDQVKQLERYFIIKEDGDAYTSDIHRHYDIIEFIYPESKKLTKGDSAFPQYKYAIQNKKCVRGIYTFHMLQLEFDTLSENQKTVLTRMISYLNIKNFEVDQQSGDEDSFRYDTMDKEKFISTFLKYGDSEETKKSWFDSR